MTNKEKGELQKEIIKGLPNKPHGRLLLAPRSGKSKLMVDLIKRDKPSSILWVTPSSELADVDIPKEFITWKGKKYLKSLTTSTWMSLNKVKGHFDLIILDEDQFITDNNIEGFFNGNITGGNIISMTGTPSGHQDKWLIYKALKLNVLYSLDLNKAVNIGLLADYTIYVHSVPMSEVNDVSAGNAKVRFMTSELKQYAYLDVQVMNNMCQRTIFARRRAVHNSPSKLAYTKALIKSLEGQKNLVFGATIKQVEELCEGTFHSKTTGEDYEKFQANQINTLGLVNSGGTGFTYKKIDNLVMVQSDADKNGLTSQKIARTLLAQGKKYKANIHMIQLLGTKDEDWVESVLSKFDRTKIVKV
tara:strand:+ start:3132 stop:4211 length:1080 start_codon:yes stop_codon:yes gene_type:complete